MKRRKIRPTNTNTNRNYNDPAYKAWRLAVYRRDGFQCQWPNCKEKKKLKAHHIRKWADYPSLRFEIDNGICLCDRHHKLIWGKEETYALMFMKMIMYKKLKKK